MSRASFNEIILLWTASSVNEIDLQGWCRTIRKEILIRFWRVISDRQM